MQPGDEIDGRFEIEAVAGAGAMGVVYRAHDRAAQCLVAVKVLSCGDSQRERFAREVELLEQLDHPNVVRYVAHGTTHAGTSYLAMEWLAGEDLAQRLSRGPVGVDGTLALARALAAALAVTHERGIIHRDIKPSNVFLVDGSIDAPKLLDFGIARATADTRALTSTGVVIGTPAYMAPEQARSERDIGPGVDVFALGCVLFECIAGAPPFRGDHVIAILAKILFDQAPYLRDIDPSVPPAVADLVAQMLEKKPGARPGDASAVLERLARLAEGEEVLPPPEAGMLMEAEQRVLCVVLVASAGNASETVLAQERRDVEHRMRDAATSRGGHIEILANGAAVATFGGAGSPTDDAARAAACALALHALLPETPIALITGRAMLSGRVPVGQAIDGAAEALVTASGRGGVHIDTTTAGLLSSRFIVAETPSGLFLSAEREGGTGVRHLLGRVTPCVGRERELSTLRATLEDALDQPASRALLVIGAAGAGKSRLVHELLLLARSTRRPHQVIFARCDAVSAGSAYVMAAETLRAAAGVQRGDAADLKLEKVRARVAQGAASSASPAVDPLMALAGLVVDDGEASDEHDAAATGDELRRAFAEWLAAECSASPVVLVIEDLHLGDGPSVQLVEAALRALHDRPLLLLATARPEVHATFPELFAEVGAQEIRLGTLPRRASESLVREVLGDGVSGETMAALVDRAGGNAFFLEELIRAVAHGGDPRDLPDTVLGVLHARLDALGAEAKRVLRAASVFGDEFAPAAVAAMLRNEDVPDRLVELTRKEILEPRRSSTVAGEQDLGFRHALIRDAAYAMLTDADRRAGHRLAGEWLESLPSAEEQADLLAHHFSHAGLWQKAVDSARRAADRAYRLNRFGEAASLLERAAGWLVELPDDAARRTQLVDVLFEQERMAEIVGAREHQRQLIRRLIGLLERDDGSLSPAVRRERLAAAHVRLGELRALTGDPSGGLKALGIARDLSRSLADLRGERAALRAMAFVGWWQGWDAVAVEHHEAVVALDRVLDDRTGLGRDLVNLAMTLIRAGARDAARARFEESLTISDQHKTPRDLMQALKFRATMYGQLGDLDQQISTLQEAVRVAELHGLLRYHLIFLASLATAHSQRGDVDAAISSHQAAVRLARDTRLRPQLAQVLQDLAAVLAGAARWSEALPHLVEAQDLLATLGDREAEAAVWSRIAEVHVLGDRPHEAAVTWDRAAALWRRALRRDRELEVFEQAARALRTAGADADEVVARYQRAEALAETMGARRRQAEHLNTLGILEWRRGRFDAALDHYSRALAMLEDDGDQAHRALLLNSVGITLERLGRRGEARERLELAAEVARSAMEPLLEGHALAILGDVHAAQGDVAAARRCYLASLALRRALADRRGEGWMLQKLAAVAVTDGDIEAAQVEGAAAAEIATALGDAELAGACARILSPPD